MPTHSFVHTRAERHPQADTGSRASEGVHVQTHTENVTTSSEVHHYPSITGAGQQNDTANCAAVVGQ